MIEIGIALLAMLFVGFRAGQLTEVNRYERWRELREAEEMMRHK